MPKQESIHIPASFYNLADSAVDDEIEAIQPASKKDIWTKMGNEVEMAGYPKDKISQLIQTTVESKLSEKLGYPAKINTAHYYTVMQENGWTDQSYSHNKKTDPETESKNTSRTKNQEMVDLAITCKESCNIIIAKLQLDTTEEFVKSFSKKEIKEFIVQRRSLLAVAQASFDEKTKVTANTEHILLQLITTEASIELAAERYMEYRLEKIKETRHFLTRKQALKFQKGTKQSKLYLLQPHDRDSAIMLDCVGQQCSKCSSWKVRVSDYDMHTCVCQDCEATEETRSIPKCPHCYTLLDFSEMAKVVADDDRCQNKNCNKLIKIPIEMKKWVKKPQKV